MSHYQGIGKRIYCLNYSPSDKLYSSETTSKFIQLQAYSYFSSSLPIFSDFIKTLYQDFLVMIKFVEYLVLFTAGFISFFFFHRKHPIRYLD